MNKKELEFVALVWEHYRRHGRRSLPWRKTKNPYHILVSEIMLQQTQVERVIPFYNNFLTQFPTWQRLADASLGEVLRAWQGLGYNRRARMLHTCAREVVDKHQGHFPRSYTTALTLPGVGPYTAGAVLAFAYQIAVPVIETNIRSVYLRYFFENAFDVSDRDILVYVTRTLPQQDVRTWYYALMDYGVYIKKTYGNPNAQSRGYVKQSTFRGSDRQIRGAILRALVARGESRPSLHKILSAFDELRVDAQLERLMQEGLVCKHRRTYQLP